MKTRLRITAVLVAGLLSSACGGGGGSPNAGNEVAVRLSEYSISPDVDHASAGTVTFRVVNAGKAKHEFVVLRTGQAAGKLPIHEGEASEAGHVGEIANIDPGQAKDLTLKLSAGHYALICNLPGHYVGGMYADFTVG